MARRGAGKPPRYRDPTLDPLQRAEDLTARLSLDEKLNQLSGCWARDLHDDQSFDTAAAAERLRLGIGHVTRIGGSTSLDPEASAGFANAIQRYLVEETEHGIPAIVHEEGVGGYCGRDATQFPQAIGQAATFNPRLVRSMAEVIRTQLKAVGARQVLAPVLDVARDPRWGRLEETFGENPYLCGRMGVAYVRGMQGSELADGVAATGKHFLGYGLPEGGLNHAPVQLGPRQLREVYAEPFAAAIREADLASVMNGYNSVDGVPCASAPSILRTLLRDELRFDGVLVADYFAVALLMRHHRVAATPLDAARLALAAGLDVELPARDCFGAALTDWLNTDDPCAAPLRGLIDEAATRALKLKFQLGLFEAPLVDVASASSCFDTLAQRTLAEQIARESVVLLENDGVLPLTGSPRLAVIGPTADDPRLHLGDYHYPAHLEIAFDQASPPPAGIAPVAASEGSTFAPQSHCVPMRSLRSVLADEFEIEYAAGCTLDGTAGGELGELKAAIAAARKADVLLVCVGGRSGLTPDATSGEFRDAADLRLTGNQEALIDRLLALGKPTIVIAIGGRAFDFSPFNQRVSALLHAWLPGEAGAEALAAIITGAESPSGRLPVSLARGVGQVPIYQGQRSGGGRSMMYGPYSDLSNKPLYAFGYGRSYGEFELGPLEGPAAVDIFGVIVVTTTLTNRGSLAAAQVVQLYLTDEVASVARPRLALAGFAKVSLAPGQRAELRFHVDASQAAYYDEVMAFVVDPGTLTLRAGFASDDLPSKLRVELEGEPRRLHQHQVVATQVAVQVVEPD